MNASGALRPFGSWLRGLHKIFGFGRRAARTGGKASAGDAARTLSKAVKPDSQVAGDVIATTNPQGFETILFKQLPRPRLTERSASDLTIEEARRYAQDATQFYDYDFPLFADGDFFYEEVEEAFLENALGRSEDSMDARFLEVMTQFRRVLNDNTRAMLLFWAPLLLISSLVGGVYGVSVGVGGEVMAAIGVVKPEMQLLTVLTASAGVGLFLAFLFFSWPFKVVQQRNLMNLDNYLTSKFARINHNFQVAKRRALNVERDKRMGQSEDLKEEAGDWTLSYHWFAMRLFLCELTIRNKFYQVRRNTTLYWGVGVLMSGLLLAALLVAGYLWRAPSTLLLTLAGVGIGALFLLSLILSRISGMMFRVMEANEWSRFHLVNLHTTIADHVGEDKVQIVTFRDRNRFE